MVVFELRDNSGKILLFANILSIILALYFQYDLAKMIWVYWAESVIIGIFTVWTLLFHSVLSRNIIALSVGLFFAGFFFVHYGGFHAGYLFFLLLMPQFQINPSQINEILITIGVLAIGHIVSFCEHIVSTKSDRVNSFGTVIMGGDTFEKPYSRIWAIHATIIASGFVLAFLGPTGIGNSILLVLFMGIKTIADIFAHNKKHDLKNG